MDKSIEVSVVDEKHSETALTFQKYLAQKILETTLNNLNF